ncbi:Protein PIN-LIKES 1 [Linum grandiflorum]
MGVLDLFIASTIPVLKVLLITALGTFLALDPVNVLGPDARKHVNNVVFYVFNPALMVANLSKTITFEQMVKLWFMPVNILVTFVVGSVLGWIVIQLTRPPPKLRGLIVGCCAGGNLGNLFLVMIPAICKEKGSPFGAPDVCQEYGLAYVSVSMAVGAIYLWTYVYNIMRASTASVVGGEDAEKLPISVDTTSAAAKDLQAGAADDDDNGGGSIEHPLLVHSSESLSKSARDGCCLFPQKMKQGLSKTLGSVNWKTLFAPSTIGVIIGFSIGLTPPIKNMLVGDDAPLRVIQDSAALLGDAAIPTLTLLVGANLLRGLKGGSEVKKTVIVGVVLARFVALPLVGIVVVKGALRFGFIPSSDPLYQFILLLQFTVPPAMNIGIITQLFGAGESECSVIMLWTYALASISLTVWSTCFMWLVAAS